MSKAQTLTTLQALLARVRSRAAEPRATYPVAALPVAPRATVSQARSPRAVLPEMPKAALPLEMPKPVEIPKTVELAADLAAEAASWTPAAPEIEVEVDVDVDMADGPVLQGAEPAAQPEVFHRDSESVERLVAAQPSTLPPPAQGEGTFMSPAEPIGVPDAPAPAPPLDLVASPAAAPMPSALSAEASPSEMAGRNAEGSADEPFESGPVSSRRPVNPEPEERLAELAFGTDEAPPPRHTPPPESGRIPAAPSDEFDADITGVRGAIPGGKDGPMRSVVQPSLQALAPEVTRADLGTGDTVMDVLDDARRFAPASFVALLDASLAL